MKRTLVAVVAALGLASSAGAASLSINAPGGLTYNVSEAIQIQVIVSSSSADSDVGIFAELFSSSSAVAGFTTASQIPFTSTLKLAPPVSLTIPFGAPWATFPLACAAGNCSAFNQLSAGFPSASDASTYVNLVLGTVTLHAGSVGTTAVSVNEISGDGNALTFFGASGVNTLNITVIPEPATAGLVALGLLGLVAAGRRR